MSETAQIQYLSPENMHKNPAYSQVITVSGPVKMVYVGGQNAVMADGQIVGKGDIAAQAEQVLKNLENALAAGGATVDNVIQWRVYMVHGQSLQAAYGVFMRAWGNLPKPPLITFLQVAALGVPDCLLEVEAVAAVPAKVP
jgi:enamine deaminase RidA (YjgF/YER057c/UK114 family)